jgi:hypothetical protein
MFTVREQRSILNKMAQAKQLERERQILGNALQALARTTGLKAKALARQPKAGKGLHPDAEIVLENAGRRHRYVVEVKAIDRAVTLNHANQQLLRYGKQGVLVAPYLTAELANHCREIGLQFIDTAGNAYLHGPGLFVYTRGDRPLGFHRDATAPRGAGTATALRVIFALLCKPELLNAPYRDIVAAAGVALGAVGWVFLDLERRGLVIGGKKGNRRFVDAARLAEEWITNYPIKLRPKLAVRRFRATHPEWWRTAQLNKHGAVWGGEVAADRLTGNREPGTYTVYLPDDPAKFVIGNRLRADPDGGIELLQKFWYFELDATYGADLAPPLLVYADLMAMPDPRNHDTARRIYDQLLGNAFRKA